MLFSGLGKLKQQSIMMAIMLMTVGLVMVICPAQNVSTLLNGVSAVLIINSMVLILKYLSSKRSLMDYVWLTVALVLGIVGMVMLVFELNTLTVISIVFGALLFVDGLHSTVHALLYARRSGRKGWWILLILSLLLMGTGVVVILHPQVNSPVELLHMTGWMVVVAAVISALRLIWVWPLKNV